MMFDIAIGRRFHSAQHTFCLDFSLQSESRRVVLVGPSGAGKSLTLKSIAGLIQADSGHVHIAGATLFDRATRVNLAPQARQLAYVFQDYALFPHLTVAQNIGFGLQQGWRNPALGQHSALVRHWLDAMQLTALADQLPSALSGGQKQRTALARALVMQPKAVLLDEPFSALDSALRQQMREQLDALQREFNFPMILITHDADDVVLFGEHVVALRDGRSAKEARV